MSEKTFAGYTMAEIKKKIDGMLKEIHAKIEERKTRIEVLAHVAKGRLQRLLLF